MARWRRRRTGVRRIVCPNPSAFTFRGTNTYIIGRGKVAVMDPGPEDAAHLAAILAATAGETITHVIITHTHRDHSPGARPLVAATGAMTYGFGPHMTPPDAGGEGGDHGFHPDVRVADGETDRGRGLGADRAAYAGALRQPPVLRAGGQRGTVQRRPCDELVDQRGLAAGWRHGGLHAQPGPAAGARRHHAAAGAWAGDHRPASRSSRRWRRTGWSGRRWCCRPCGRRAGRRRPSWCRRSTGALDPRLVGPAGRSLLSHLIKLAGRGGGGAGRRSVAAGRLNCPGQVGEGIPENPIYFWKYGTPRGAAHTRRRQWWGRGGNAFSSPTCLPDRTRARPATARPVPRSTEVRKG